MTLHHPVRSLALLLALACATTAMAQTVIYKVRYADGRIGFTDSPPRDATILERRDASSLPNATAAPAPAPRPVVQENAAGRPAAPAASGGAAAADLSVAWQEIADAQRAVDEARRALESGREPLPGERLGLAGGGSRLSPDYDARMRGLEEALAAAEARLKDAHAARNAAR
jgi:hypothetical protein